MSKRIFVFWSFLLSSLLSTQMIAQTIIILDKESKEPLEKVTLVSQEEGEKILFVVTDSLGRADLSVFKKRGKNAPIQVSMFGYHTQTKTYEELRKTKQIELSIDDFLMEAVVVSAVRWEQETSEIPQKITSISQKQITFQSPQTAADMLTISGEVLVQKSQAGGGSPMIRGFAANRLLYTVDGVRMNTAIFRSGNLQNVISLDPFAMQSAEVLFGAGSVIYGSDAIGGVMSFQTLMPQLSKNDKLLVKGSAVGRFSSANLEKTGHFDINVGSKKWSFLSSFSHSDFQHVRMGENGSADTEKYLRLFYVDRIGNKDTILTNPDPYLQVPSEYSQFNTMQKVRFRPNKKWDLTYAFHYSQTSDYDRYDRHIQYRNGLPKYGEWRYSPQKWMMNQLSVHHQDAKKYYDQINIRLAQQYFEEGRISRSFKDDLRQTRTEKVDAYSINIDFKKRLSPQNQLFYGVEYVRNDVQSIGKVDNILTKESFRGASRYPNSDWNSYAVYIANNISISDKFVLQSGARYNHFSIHANFDTEFYDFPFSESNLNKGALTGNLGGVYSFMKSFEGSLNLSSGFRSPNVDDMGKVFDSQPGAVVVPNPNLSAEYAYNVDVSLSKTFGDFLKIGTTVYYTYLDNALAVRNFSLDGRDSIFYDGELSQVQAVQNASSAQVYGFQLNLEARLPYHLRLSSTFNYQKGQETIGEQTAPSRHAAPSFGVVRLRYEHQNLQLELNSFYSGQIAPNEMPPNEAEKVHIYAEDKLGRPYSPAWRTFNFRAMYNFEKYVSLNFAIENITDRRYKTYSSGIAAVGRNFVFGVRARF